MARVLCMHSFSDLSLFVSLKLLAIYANPSDLTAPLTVDRIKPAYCPPVRHSVSLGIFHKKN